MISSNNRHFTLAGSAGSAGDPHVNVGTFFHLLSWMNHQVQGGAPQTLCLLVYKPHEYHRYITYKP